MVVQLPTEALGVAISILIYAFLCLACSSLTIWLVWTHHERDSYVALLSYVTFLGTAASIIQQFHTLVWWRDIKVEQYEYALAHLGSPELAIAGSSVGLDLVLFYIQYYSYNAEAVLTFLWATSLAHAIFNITDLGIFKRIKRKTNAIAKCVAIILPAVLMCLLRLDDIQRSPIGFLILANFNMMISLSIGGILLIAILVKYFHTRHRLVSWNIRYWCARRSQETCEIINVLDQGEGRQSIYDRWLVIRFSLAFVVIGTFQLLTILSELAQLQHHTRENLGDFANVSADGAKNDFVLFMPGVSTSVLVFVVFGTTRTFRKAMYRTFIPRRFRRKKPEVGSGNTAITAEALDEEVNDISNRPRGLRLKTMDHEAMMGGNSEDREPPNASTTSRIRTDQEPL
ncbi:hypothetical protein F4779DRAFT_128258 [Xylariaceae sp. FL0662B]|nr:hypothetical protein F4779DRAFT_128258 [Xylariaceae sp. FL0662B]